LSVTLAARMVRLAGLAATLEAAEARVRAALTSGQGLDKFRAIIARQGGDPRGIEDYGQPPTAPRRLGLPAERGGWVPGPGAQRLGGGTVVLGGGRDRVEDVIDHAVGAVVLAHRGQEVRAGDGLVELHYRDAARLEAAQALLAGAWEIGDEPPAAAPLILET